LIPVSLAAIEYLTLNMREIDRAEIFGLRNHDSPTLLAYEVATLASYGKAAIAEHKGRPCGIIGVFPMWSGVWSAFSFGTDDWRHGVLSMTSWAKFTMHPHLRQCNAHRLQCESRIDHHEAHRWLTRMGAEADGLLRGYGRDGSDYIMFSWKESGESVQR